MIGDEAVGGGERGGGCGRMQINELKWKRRRSTPKLSIKGYCKLKITLAVSVGACALHQCVVVCDAPICCEAS